MLALRIPFPTGEITHAWYKFYTFIRKEYLSTGWNRDKIIEEINQEGFPAFSGSCSEIYLEKSFKRLNLGPKERLPIARELGETSLMFLIHPTITEAEMDQYSEIIKGFIKGN